MQHYRNINTGNITTRLPSAIGPHKGLTYPRDWSIAVAAGWRVLERAVVPDGYIVTGRRYEDNAADTQREVLDLQEVWAAQAAADAALVTAMEPVVRQIADLLSIFGLRMPVEEQEVMATVYAASKLNTALVPDGTLLLALYSLAREHGRTQADIYRAALALGLADPPPEAPDEE